MKFRIITFSLVFGLFFISSCSDDEEGMVPADTCENVTVSYANDIAPIAIASCALAGCHVAGFANGDFTSYAGLKDAADGGGLKRAVVDLRTMPATGSITDAQRSLFECWIADGAPDN